MKLIKSMIVMICAGYACLFATDFEVYIECGYYDCGTISFDEHDNVWFSTDQGLYMFDQETQEPEYMSYIRGLNRNILLEFNSNQRNDAPIVKWFDDIMIFSVDNDIYIRKDSIITQMNVENKPGNRLLFTQGNKFDDDKIWIDIYEIEGGDYIIPHGLHEIDIESLNVKKYPYGRDGRGFANVFGYGMKLYKYGDKIYYPGFGAKLNSFNKDTAETIDILQIVEDSSDFNTIFYSYFYQDKMYFFGFDEKLYEYNLGTGEHSFEDICNTSIYEENKNDLGTFLFDRLGIAHICDEYTLIRVYKIKGADLLYIKPTGSDKYSRIDIDPSKYEDFYSITADKDGKIWMYIECKAEQNGMQYDYLSLVKFDPLTMVSVEDSYEFNTSIISTIYPNPVQKTATLEYKIENNFFGKVNFEIFDYSGKKIKDLKSENVNFGSESIQKNIDVSDLAPGSYYLMIDNGIEKKSVSFVVE